MEIKPFGTRVVAKRIELVQQSEIIVAGQNKKISNAAEIVCVGPEVQHVKAGDKVIFINNMTFEFLGEQLVTFFEADILGLLV